MVKESDIAGYFYWKVGLKGPVSERIPIDSGTSAPRPYLMKVALSEGEMELSLMILEKRYPYFDDEEDDAT